MELMTLINAESRVLEARLAAIRATIPNHQGEKGRSVEYEVMKILRDFLPAEYGLSTGFIVSHPDARSFSDDGRGNYTFQTDQGDPEISTQQDIIIYDALRAGPIARLGSCEVFPIEAVYGCIEVKTVLNAGEIRKCLINSHTIRNRKTRAFYVTEGRTAARLVPINENNGVVSIRYFIFAVEYDGSEDCGRIKSQIEESSRLAGPDAFISGMYVGSRGFFYSHAVNRDDPNDEANRHHVYCIPTNPLFEFKWSLLHSLARFPRVPLNVTPAIDTYFRSESAPAVVLTNTFDSFDLLHNDNQAVSGQL